MVTEATHMNGEERESLWRIMEEEESRLDEIEIRSKAETDPRYLEMMSRLGDEPA